MLFAVFPRKQKSPVNNKWLKRTAKADIHYYKYQNQVYSKQKKIDKRQIKALRDEIVSLENIINQWKLEIERCQKKLCALQQSREKFMQQMAVLTRSQETWEIICKISNCDDNINIVDKEITKNTSRIQEAPNAIAIASHMLTKKRNALVAALEIAEMHARQEFVSMPLLQLANGKLVAKKEKYIELQVLVQENTFRDQQEAKHSGSEAQVINSEESLVSQQPSAIRCRHIGV